MLIYQVISNFWQPYELMTSKTSQNVSVLPLTDVHLHNHLFACLKHVSAVNNLLSLQKSTSHSPASFHALSPHVPTVLALNAIKIFGGNVLKADLSGEHGRKHPTDFNNRSTVIIPNVFKNNTHLYLNSENPTLDRNLLTAAGQKEAPKHSR